MTAVEVVVLNDDGTWETREVEIPSAIAETESHDDFIKWLYSDEEEAMDLLEDLDPEVAVFVVSWSLEEMMNDKESDEGFDFLGEDLDDPLLDDDDEDDEEDVMMEEQL